MLCILVSVSPDQVWRGITKWTKLICAGSDLPQLLKAEWLGSLPHAVQLPYTEGDSYAKRVAEHAARRPARRVDSEVRAALPKPAVLPADVSKQKQKQQQPLQLQLEAQRKQQSAQQPVPDTRGPRPAIKGAGHLAVFEDR